MKKLKTVQTIDKFLLDKIENDKLYQFFKRIDKSIRKQPVKI